MARVARLVIPGVPHHIIQRGNRRMQTFFKNADFEMYLTLLAKYSKEAGLNILAYCLMPNHVHLVVIPRTEDSLRAGISEAHRRYTRYINFQKKWRGHLWQERFHSYPLDDAHLYQTIRYVELNPVKAKMVKRPETYLWSSARFRLKGSPKPPIQLEDPLEIKGEWKDYWNEGIELDQTRKLEMHARTGRPLGSVEFIKKLEKKMGKPLAPQKRGPKVHSKNN